MISPLETELVSFLEGKDVERLNELKISRNILDVQNWSNIKHVNNFLFSFILHSEVCILVYWYMYCLPKILCNNQYILY